MAAFFTIVGLWPLVGGAGPRVWALGIAGVFALLARVWPDALAPLNRIWFRFGLLLHRIVSPVVLAVLFFLTVTPMALLLRILGKDLLRLRWDREAASYWIERDPPGPEPETMIHQF